MCHVYSRRFDPLTRTLRCCNSTLDSACGKTHTLEITVGDGDDDDAVVLDSDRRLLRGFPDKNSSFGKLVFRLVTEEDEEEERGHQD